MSFSLVWRYSEEWASMLPLIEQPINFRRNQTARLVSLWRFNDSFAHDRDARHRARPRLLRRGARSLSPAARADRVVSRVFRRAAAGAVGLDPAGVVAGDG